MTKSGQHVRLPQDVAAAIVAGHVHALWDQVVNEEEKDLRGCCKRCCAPCNALAELLDELYGIYHRTSGGQSDVWDEARQEIDRSWFATAWHDDLGCHEEASNA